MFQTKIYNYLNILEAFFVSYLNLDVFFFCSRVSLDPFWLELNSIQWRCTIRNEPSKAEAVDLVHRNILVKEKKSDITKYKP